jgi:muramidase (phage lysozyme)
MHPNVAAFLSMIAHSEGTDRLDNPYRCCYGFKHLILDLSDHPAITGEWRGEPLPDAMCIAAGFSPGCVSTAAGRYQLTRPTWTRLKATLRLSDFTGPSQDDACVQLLKENDAFNLVIAGRVADAITACHREWASLPGNAAGQPQTDLATLIHTYADAGGAFA